jgi:mono/diheme cytochrome c family protein
MRYFFLAYALIALLVVGIFGLRGQKFTKPPVRIFPDMDEQDKLKAQKPSGFFSDGLGSRLPIAQAQPRGFNPEGERIIGGIPEHEFGGQAGYYYTGHIGDYYGNGMPEELGLTPENAAELIQRGKERFGIYCAVCHGASGDGNGITANYGVPVAANPNAKLNALTQESYPDGRLYEVITNGKGLMSGYGYNIPVRDRWAIVAYIHTLQAAKATSK